MKTWSESLTIGKAAQRAGVGVETIRFYEREGLIDEPPRRESGYRQYPEGVVSRLRFIRRARQLGFALAEIRELLSLRVDPGAHCDEMRTRAKAKIAEIQGKVRTLQRMERALAGLVTACETQNPTRGCPILDAMEENNES